MGKLRYRDFMQKIEFTKMHGLGNDFVIIDRRSNKIEINDNLIQKLSDRRTGAGCDQLITINNTVSGNVDVSIDIFNPAGDKAEACGNGTRCVAKILFDENNEKETFVIVTKQHSAKSVIYQELLEQTQHIDVIFAPKDIKI